MHRKSLIVKSGTPEPTAERSARRVLWLDKLVRYFFISVNIFVRVTITTMMKKLDFFTTYIISCV